LNARRLFAASIDYLDLEQCRFNVAQRSAAPLRDACPTLKIGRDQFACFLGDVDQDRPGFRENEPVVVYHRHLIEGTYLAKALGLRVSQNEV
jgi:hypothetical protein